MELNLGNLQREGDIFQSACQNDWDRLRSLGGTHSEDVAVEAGKVQPASRASEPSVSRVCSNDHTERRNGVGASAGSQERIDEFISPAS